MCHVPGAGATYRQFGVDSVTAFDRNIVVFGGWDFKSFGNFKETRHADVYVAKRETPHTHGEAQRQ